MIGDKILRIEKFSLDNNLYCKIHGEITTHEGTYVNYYSK